MRELAVIADLNNFEIIGILDHHYYGNTADIEGIPVIGDERWLLDDTNSMAKQFKRTCEFFPANFHQGQQCKSDELDLAKLRLDRINLLDQSGVTVANLIHPDASIPPVSKYARYTMGRGVLMCAMACHNGANIEIGDYCAIMSGSTCTHDVKLSRNVILAPHTDLYNCIVGENSFIGMHSRMIPVRNNMQITIGANVTVWHCADVVTDIPNNSIYTTDQRILKKWNYND